MTLFLAQLQNQDPTNPMQSYELAAQLAQFTTVQELSQNTSLLGNLQQYTAALNNGEVTSLVGQQVSAQLNTINVSSGTPSALNYTLPASGTVTITIQNSEGSTINTVKPRLSERGNLQRAVDGQGLERKHCGRRPYTCTISSAGSDGTATTISPFVSGQVYSCNLNNNPPTYTTVGSKRNPGPGSERLCGNQAKAAQIERSEIR